MQYLETLHGKSKGYVTRATINDEYKQWHYKYSLLILQDFDGNNIYISPNTFYKTFRRVEAIKELNCLFSDLDFYKDGFTKEQILFNLKENYFEKKIPDPSFIIDSGRGLYLMWCLDKPPSQALPLWQACEDYFFKVLKDLGADKNCVDCTRILRVPGSINSKSGTEVKILYKSEKIYTLREIQSEYLPELQKTEKKKKGRPCKIVTLHNERSLYFARLHDLMKICEIRNYDIIGYRERVLFLYRYYTCYFSGDIKEAEINALALNKLFTYPLKKKEVLSATRSAETAFLNKKQYKYKNCTLIELFGITEEEQEQMKTVIGRKEKCRRNRLAHKEKYKAEERKQKYLKKLEDSGEKTKKTKIKERQKKVLALMQQGLKQKEISTKLNISLRTCKYDIQYLKENNLM